jgi:four helix bundle protein
MRKTKKDFAHFVRISLGSLTEVNAALEVSIELGYLKKETYRDIRKKLETLFFKLIGLEKYLRK